MTAIPSSAMRGLTGLDRVGDWIGMLGIRLLPAYEFGSAGLEKRRDAQCLEAESAGASC
jgi:hypothetical protein